MSDILNTISHTAKKVARKTTKKVGEIANITKYSVKLKAKDADLGEKLEKLGKLYYSYTKLENEETKAKLDNCLKEVEALQEEIAELRKKVAEVKEEVECTNCGGYVPQGKTICPSCKKSLERIEIEFSLDEE